MDRRRYLGTIGAVAVSSVAGCLGRDSLPEPQDIESRVTSDSFQTRREGEEWRDLSVHGVNLGMAKPGRFPGEAAITKAEYARWLEGISEMNANVIRTYTLHPPGFYEALAEHNADREEPLFVLHGNWVAEPVLADAGDAFDDEVVEVFPDGLEEIIDAVHGDLSVSERVGQADGTYRADVSPYVLGYVLGIEWPPEVVEETDDANAGIGDYDVFYYLYAELLESIPTVEYAGEGDSGEFHPIELALNRELQIPSQDRTVGFESHGPAGCGSATGIPRVPSTTRCPMSTSPARRTRSRCVSPGS